MSQPPGEREGGVAPSSNKTRWECVSSQKRRDLPTPGSPTTATTWPCPTLARSRAPRSCSSSAFRPTKRVSPRRAAASRRVRAAPAPTRSNTSTGSLSPLIGTGPSGVTWTKPSARCSVAPVSRMLPGAASCSMRAARCVVWPTAV